MALIEAVRDYPQTNQGGADIYRCLSLATNGEDRMEGLRNVSMFNRSMSISNQTYYVWLEWTENIVFDV